MAGTWLTAEEIRALWPDAPDDDAQLGLLLAASRITCEAYAKPLPGGEPVPENYRAGQLLQARAIWNSGQTGLTDDTIGFDAISVRVWPMSGDVRKLLRPRRGVPGIF